MAGRRETTIRTVDDVDLHVVSDGVPDAEVAIVLAHGFTMSGSNPRMETVAGTLAVHGFAVHRFDFRGHGRSGGMSTLGDVEIWDIDAVVRHARACGARRVVVVGASMGGFVALRHAALLTGEDAVVTISAPAVWGVAHRARARALTLAATTTIGRRVLSARGTRVQPGPPYLVGSPPELAADIHIPVAILHGDRDPYVPLDDALLVYEHLGGPRQLRVLPNYGHAEAGYTPELALLLVSVIDELLAVAGPPPEDEAAAVE